MPPIALLRSRETYPNLDYSRQSRLSDRDGRLSGLILGWGALTSFFNCFEHLFDDFRMQVRAAMERNRDPQAALAIDSVTAFGAQEFKASREQFTLCLESRPARSLGIYLDGSGEDFTAEEIIPLVRR